MGHLTGRGAAGPVGVRPGGRPAARARFAQEDSGEAVGTDVVGEPACEAIDCPEDRAFSPETCTCDCPSGTVNCNDLCLAPCPPIEAYDDACVCQPIVCPPDRVLTCTCDCPPGLAECKGQCLPTCRPGQIFDGGCRCVCRPNIACGEGKKLDPESCRCVCKQEISCPPGGWTFDRERCACHCNANCPRGWTFEVEDCSCRCEVTCRDGWRLDAQACRCICDDSTCPTGRVFNPTTCRCDCDGSLSCQAGKVIDAATCECVCPADMGCRAGQAFDEATCACVDVCTPGSLLETITVPCNRKSVSSKLTLTKGMNYTLSASGTCIISTTVGLDAEYQYYRLDGSSTSDGILCSNGVRVDYGIGIDDPAIDDSKTPHWGPYNPKHVYMTDFVGKGAPINLNFHDCLASDNANSLTVRIFCPGPTADSTTASG